MDKPQTGGRVVWLTGPDRKSETPSGGSWIGRRGTVVCSGVKTCHYKDSPLKIAVEWDDEPNLRFYFQIIWGKQLAPLPVLDALAEI